MTSTGNLYRFQIEASNIHAPRALDKVVLLLQKNQKYPSMRPDVNHFEKPGKRRSRSLLSAIHPLHIPEANLRFSHTFGLGGMALVIVLLQVLTGILLRFHYEPSPAGAFDSVLFIQNNIIFGSLIRNAHHWAGMFLIIIAFLHLLRVFLTGAFLPPRHWNWVIGTGLFLLAILLNFTGYLLPWDQLSYWAVTVSTSMFDYVPLVGEGLKTAIRGGGDVGPATLSGFYTWHTALLPGLLTILLVWHFWKVRKNGGVILPRNVDKSTLKLTETFPNLVNRELVAALALTAIILLFSLLFDAPLQEKANPAFSPNPAKSPWYFQGFQEMLLHFHPVFAVVIIPLILWMGFTFFPFIRFEKNSRWRDFNMETFTPIVTWSVITGIVITVLLILLDEYVFHFQEHITLLPSWVSEGLFPVLLLALLAVVYSRIIGLKFSNRRIDMILALFILFTTAYLVLMLTGTFFRGEGMQLIF